MTILIINNYEKEENLSRANQIAQVLRNLGESKLEVWSFWEINEKTIPRDVDACMHASPRHPTEQLTSDPPLYPF